MWTITENQGYTLPFYIRVEGETDDEDEEREAEDRHHHHQDQCDRRQMSSEMCRMSVRRMRAKGDAAVIASGHPFAGKVWSSSSHGEFAILSNGLQFDGPSNLSDTAVRGIGGEGNVG